MTIDTTFRFDFIPVILSALRNCVCLGMIFFTFMSCGNKEGSLKSGNSESSPEKEMPVAESSSEPQKAVLKDSIKADLNITEPEDIHYNIPEIPADLTGRIDGSIVASANFTDLNGRNYVLITETSETERGEYREKRIYGYHFAGDKLEQLWKVQDYIVDCEFDVTVDFIEGSLSITDLNRNGVAESVFLYKLSCKSDVSPDDMKLIMHEGSTKYAIRGVMDLDMESYGRYDGTMKVDASFNSAPEGFRDYAVKQWNKYKVERIGY